jgi:hypothetical protein
MIFDFKISDEYGKSIFEKKQVLKKNSEVDSRKCLDTFEDIHCVMFGTDFSEKSIEIEDAEPLEE